MRLTVNKKTLWLSIYTFMVIFAPNFTSYISTVYLVGGMTVILLITKDRQEISHIFNMSNVLTYCKLIALLLIFIVFGYLYFNYNSNLFLEDWLRCVNRLILLTGFLLLETVYIIYEVKKIGENEEYIFQIIINAGIIQGIFVVLSFLNPSIRAVLTKYNTQSLMQNAWFVARRGYGFSDIMVDVFGYGIALIVAALLLTNNKKSALYKVMVSLLMIFSTAVNSRTGLILIAFVFFFCLLDQRWRFSTYIKVLVVAVLGIVFLYSILPVIVDYLIQNTNNATLKWIGEGFLEINELLFEKQSYSDTYVLSSGWEYPRGIIANIIGSGHSCYGTEYSLGFATDNGYINLIWEFGWVGMAMFEYCFLSLLIRAGKLNNEKYKRFMYCLVCIFIVTQLKGNLVGYNPGTAVMYLLIFPTIYFGRCKN